MIILNYSYNLYDNTAKINKVFYNILWKGQYLVIIDSNRCKMDAPSLSDKLVKIITSYLACLTKEGGIEQIHFLLVEKSCQIPKNLRDIMKLLADIQKK